jgi:hypothetical protein
MVCGGLGFDLFVSCEFDPPGLGSFSARVNNSFRPFDGLNQDEPTQIRGNALGSVSSWCPDFFKFILLSFELCHELFTGDRPLNAISASQEFSSASCWFGASVLRLIIGLSIIDGKAILND